jgi:hypothetical protein
LGENEKALIVPTARATGVMNDIAGRVKKARFHAIDRPDACLRSTFASASFTFVHH